MIKTSVIIPTYNRSKYLPDALDSALGQTLQDLEIIVVDDGSIDNSKEIVDGYLERHPRKIRYFYQKNKGPSAARNRGIAEAWGEFIAFLDSDDIWLPNHLQQLSTCLKKYPRADVAFSAVEYFGEAKDIVECLIGSKRLVARILKESFEQKEDAVWLSTKNLLNSVLIDGTPFRCQGSLMRRDIFFDKKLLFDEDVSYTEDGLFFTMAAAYSQFLYVNNIGLRVRRHVENDKNAMYGSKIPDSCDRMVVKLKDFFRDQKLEPSTKKALKICLTELQCDAMSGRLNNKDITLWMREALKFIIRLPGWTSMKMSVKLIIKRILSLNETN